MQPQHGCHIIEMLLTVNTHVGYVRWEGAFLVEGFMGIGGWSLTGVGIWV